MAESPQIPTTQEELFQERVEIYRNPDTGVPVSTKEPVSTLKNRENQISRADDMVQTVEIGFGEIDEAILYYFTEVIKPVVTVNETQTAVPIIYGTPERWHSIQKEGFLRDKDGKMQMPLIILKKTLVEQRKGLSSKIDAHIPRNFMVVSSTYSKRNQYSRFGILNNRVPEKEYYLTTVPDYVNITYDCIILTDYVEQSNKLLESINFASGSYWGDPQKFLFRASMNSYSINTQVSKETDRITKVDFKLTVSGYIISSAPNTVPIINRKEFTKTSIKIQERLEV